MTIAPGLHSIAYTSGGRVHAFLVEYDGGLILIDTGFDKDAKKILDEITRIGQVPRNIKAILATHAHKSHISGLASIVAMGTAIVYAAESEIPIIMGFAKAKPVGWRWPKPWNFEVAALQLALNMGIGSHTPVRVDQRLREGDKVGPLEVLEVPGHTPGSIALWHSGLKALFTGDSVSSWPSVQSGWPSFHLDEKQAVRSVAKMADLSAVKILLVGHGSPITDGAADILKELSRKPL